MGLPTQKDDDEHVRLLKEEGKSKLILATAFEAPPQWWPAGITQNPVNIFTSHTALNAKHQGMVSGNEGFATTMTAPTPTDVEFEYGDDNEMKEMERMMQGRGEQPGPDRDKMQHAASQIMLQVEKVMADPEGRGGGDFPLPPVLPKMPSLPRSCHNVNQSLRWIPLLAEH